MTEKKQNAILSKSRAIIIKLKKSLKRNTEKH